MMLANNYFVILLILSFFLVLCFVLFLIARKYDYQQPQNQADSVQLSLE